MNIYYTFISFCTTSTSLIEENPMNQVLNLNFSDLNSIFNESEFQEDMKKMIGKLKMSLVNLTNHGKYKKQLILPTFEEITEIDNAHYSLVNLKKEYLKFKFNCKDSFLTKFGDIFENLKNIIQKLPEQNFILQNPNIIYEITQSELMEMRPILNIGMVNANKICSKIKKILFILN